MIKYNHDYLHNICVAAFLQNTLNLVVYLTKEIDFFNIVITLKMTKYEITTSFLMSFFKKTFTSPSTFLSLFVSIETKLAVTVQ